MSTKTPKKTDENLSAEHKVFRHPKIFSDVLAIYKQYYSKHEGLPKIFRVTIGTEIMRELASCLKFIVLANHKKNSNADFVDSVYLIKELRGSIELLKSYMLVAWEMKFISHGFYIEIMNRLEEISKQAAAWNDWLDKQSKNK